jgi:hypothetical protein
MTVMRTSQLKLTLEAVNTQPSVWDSGTVVKVVFIQNDKKNNMASLIIVHS